MKPKRILAAEAIPVRVVIITLDNHLSSAVQRSTQTLLREIPGLSIVLHAATDWGDDPGRLAACRSDIGQAHIIIINLLVMEDHIKPILSDLVARREHCDALVAAMSAGEVIRLTTLGSFQMNKPQSGAI
ncbi:MAG: DUF3479 domain-containing protein, partial [Pseudohongiellaceae bacterium]